MAHELHPGLAVLREYIPDDNLRRDFISDVLHEPGSVRRVADNKYQDLFWAGGADSYSGKQLLAIMNDLDQIEKFIRSL